MLTKCCPDLQGFTVQLYLLEMCRSVNHMSHEFAVKLIIVMYIKGYVMAT